MVSAKVRADLCIKQRIQHATLLDIDPSFVSPICFTVEAAHRKMRQPRCFEFDYLFSCDLQTDTVVTSEAD